MSSPGTGPDIVTRLIGSKLAEAWGQQVVVDVRPGAAGRVGAEIAAKAAPDGYTLAMIASQAAIVAAMFDKLNYDLIKDFSPISLLASVPHIMVANPSVPAVSIKELIALAKAKPGALQYGSAGPGSPQHLEFELLKSMTGIDLYNVSYKGAGPAMTDVIAGQIQLTVQVVPVVMPFLKVGKVRALGVTSLKRTPLAPDLPTISESVPGYEFIGWYGLAAPARTPAKIIFKLNAELVKMMNTAEFRERFSSIGVEPLSSATTPQEFALHIRSEVEKKRQIIKAAGIRPE